jgi:sulfotransferase family protein
MTESPSPRSRRRSAGAARDGAPALAVTPTTDAPVFLIGAPRSGTTLLYKALCLHPGVSYISNWHRRVPGLDAIAALNRVPRRISSLQAYGWFEHGDAYVYGRHRGLLRRIVPAPVEGEPIFVRAGVPADAGLEPAPGEDAVIARLRASFDRVRRYGGGNHVVSKRIANNRRIPLLARAFPEARFVNLVRDGRAVAYSLAGVDWWESDVVWWCGRTPTEWAAAGADPWELCAQHWVEEVSAVDRGLESVPASHVLSIRYEQLIDDPAAMLLHVAGFAGLGDVDGWRERAAKLCEREVSETWRKLGADDVKRIETVQRPHLESLGYLP